MSLRLLAAVPTHSQTIVVEAAQALIAAQEVVLRRSGSFRLHFESGATISLVRNAIVSEFLASDADLLLMLDADQAIDAATLERMIDLNKPMVGCMYPSRRFDWARLDLNSLMAPRELVCRATPFVGHLLTDQHGNLHVIEGFARATHVGTGILLLRREVFESLMLAFPELKHRGFGEDAYPQYSTGPRWGFFNPIDNEDGVPLSEDISFCRRWITSGGEIWADVGSTTVHVGRQPFSGSFLEKLDFVIPKGHRVFPDSLK
jgi:hypothetical protein